MTWETNLNVNEGGMMNRMSRLATVIAIVVGLGLLAAPASAMSMSTARHKVVGGCIYKHDKHVLSCISGTYPFKRLIKHKRHWHKRTFYGVVLSAQHCVYGKHPHCWGRTIGGRLRAMNPPGRAVPSKSGGAPTNYCFQVVCTNPFFWTTGVAQGIVNLQDKIVDPCEAGGLQGFAGGIGGNLVAKAMLSSGAIGETTALAKLSSPEAIAYLSVAGCAAKVAQPASNRWQDFLSGLQHFGQPRTAVRHGAR